MLHQSEKMKELLPFLSTVTRQDKNVAQIVISGRHWNGATNDDDDGDLERRYGNQTHPDPGNHILHSTRCKAYKRMTDGRTKFKSSKTGREYKITRHYNCLQRFTVYLVTCLLCESRPQYTGQSRVTIARRHLGHRAEIKRGEIGLGEHFKKHMVDNNWDIEEVSEILDLTIIGSVEEGRKNAMSHLDDLETNFTNRLMSMNKHGGMNVRDDTKRGNK